MSKAKLKTSLPAGACCLALAAAVSGWYSQSANAQCSTSAGGSIDVRGPYPSPNNHLIHIGETATIFSVGVNNLNPGACDLQHLKAWVIYPNNSFQGFVDDIPLAQGTLIACPSADPNCIAFSTTYVVTAADEANSLSFSTNWPTGFTSSFVSGGHANTVQFGVAGAALAVDATGQAQGNAVPQITGQLIVLHPCISITKNCAFPPGQSCFLFGTPISFAGTVSNCGDTRLFGVTLTDTPAASTSFGTTTSSGRTFDGTLTNGESITYTGSYTPTEPPCTQNDTISVSAQDVTGFGVSASASASCPVCNNPAITLTKTCGPGPVTAGQPIPFSITVSNSGNIPLTGVSIVDTTPDGQPAQTFTCADLAPGQTCTVTGNNQTTVADCPSLTDTATVNAVSICDQTPVSATQSCTTPVQCVPHISITKQVACFLPGNTCGTFGPTATGDRNSACPAFCWQVTIVNTDPTVTVGSITLTDTAVPADTTVQNGFTAAAFTGFPLAPGASTTVTVSPDTICATTVNTVTATPFTGANATGTAGPAVTASATAIVSNIVLTCAINLHSDLDMDANPTDNHVTLPAGSINAPIQVSLTLANPGTADEIVTSVAGLPPLVLCTDDTTAVDPATVLGLPLSLPAGGSVTTVLGCWLVTCNGGVGGNFAVTASANADDHKGATCVFDSAGNIISTSTATPCPATVNCQVPTTCRTTGGGTMYNCDSNMDCVLVTTHLFPLVSTIGQPLDHVSHGGQLGAPYSQQDCATILADQCIRGQWQHNRHFKGPNNPADVFAVDFHTAGTNAASHPLFDTLLCACLGCCNPDFANIKQPAGNFTGWANLKFGLCNPDDHKVCGPAPRPAPDNALIWTGIGTFTPSSANGNRPATYAVLRVYVEDHSEPGGWFPKGSVSPADVYCFQAWDTGIAVAKHSDPNNLGSGQGIGACLGDINTFRSTLSADSCAFLQSIAVNGACPPGSLPQSSVAGCPATVNDCGILRTGNQQIHPSTAATCTAPGGIPAPAPGPINSPVCAPPPGPCAAAAAK